MSSVRSISVMPSEVEVKSTVEPESWDAHSLSILSMWLEVRYGLIPRMYLGRLTLPVFGIHGSPFCVSFWRSSYRHGGHCGRSAAYCVFTGLLVCTSEASRQFLPLVHLIFLGHMSSLDSDNEPTCFSNIFPHPFEVDERLRSFVEKMPNVSMLGWAELRTASSTKHFELSQVARSPGNRTVWERISRKERRRYPHIFPAQLLTPPPNHPFLLAPQPDTHTQHSPYRSQQYRMCSRRLRCRTMLAQPPRPKEHSDVCCSCWPTQRDCRRWPMSSSRGQ
jgi:hypothetical protein